MHDDRRTCFVARSFTTCCKDLEDGRQNVKQQIQRCRSGSDDDDDNAVPDDWRVS